MVGVKGRSGRPSTPEHATQKRLAGIASAAARYGSQATPKPPESPPPQLAGIEDYDAQLGRPSTWGDAKRREEVRGELTLNQARVVDLEKAQAALAQLRGSLLTRDQAVREVADYAAALLDGLSAIIDAGLAHVPQERQPAARLSMQRAIDAIRLKAVADIRGRK